MTIRILIPIGDVGIADMGLVKMNRWSGHVRTAVQRLNRGWRIKKRNIGGALDAIR
jgi:hypothetical protein